MPTTFRIQDKVLNVSPFDTKTANAIWWMLGDYMRGEPNVTLYVNLVTVNAQNNIIDSIYSYQLRPPATLMTQITGNASVDDYIISQSNGKLIKI